MEININNIGLVADSTIALDGLTVITGKNNSGKTTVGKVLFAMLDAVTDLQVKARRDRAYYLRKKVNEATQLLFFFQLFIIGTRKNKNLLSKYPAIDYLFSNGFENDYSLDDIEQLAHDFLEELHLLDVDELIADKNFMEVASIVSKRNNSKKTNEYISKSIDNAKTILETAFDELNDSNDMLDYVRESINQTLQVEFSQQIQPVRVPVRESSVELAEDGHVCFKFSIQDNSIINDGKPVFITSPFNKVHFIDSPYVLDESIIGSRTKRYKQPEKESFLNVNRILSHSDRLNTTLKEPAHRSVLEQTVINKSLKRIIEKIDRIIPGSFEFSESGDYYVQNDSKLKVSNLAAGSKMFSIIKILLNHGELDDKTMLILDEPESHLHPEWQNVFAEIIVLLVKELGVRVLLTTHSTNFLLGIDANMRKYGIVNNVNFYQTDMLENGLVKYKCVNDCIETIYGDYLKYLTQMKVMRDMYLLEQEDS